MGSGPVAAARAPDDEEGHLMDARDVIDHLGLVPLTVEGGWYRETWRADESIPSDALPPRYGSPRSHGTAIYYLLTPKDVSRIHRLSSDEVFHFYLGDPVEMTLLDDGGSHTVVLGHDLLGGQVVQQTVPRGVWQGCRLLPGGLWALLGTTVAPGFDYGDYENGDRTDLTKGWPLAAAAIGRLTPPPAAGR